MNSLIVISFLPEFVKDASEKTQIRHLESDELLFSIDMLKHVHVSNPKRTKTYRKWYQTFTHQKDLFEADNELKQQEMTIF